MDGELSRILLAYDGSPGARDALVLAARLARPTGAQVVLVHVVDLPPAGTDVLDPELRERSEHALAAGVARLAQLGVETVDTYTVPGPTPGRVLKDEAVALEADLLVIGSSHHGVMHAILVGSTADDVLDGAPCPVLVAPRHDHD